MTNRDQFISRWPQFALAITVNGARLEAPTDADLAALARATSARGAILTARQAHFVTWLRGRTPDEIRNETIARVQRNRDLTQRPGWTLDLAVIVDGVPVGMQSVSGFDRWPRRRVVGTSSWLLATSQHRGLGTTCRAAVIEVAFSHLRAERARSWVLADNHASTAVSEKLGYQLVDTRRITEDGRIHTERVYELSAEEWFASEARQRNPASVTGAQGLAELLDH